MSYYTSWAISSIELISADSKREAAEILKDMKGLKQQMAEQSLCKAGVVDVLRCKKIIKKTRTPNKKYAVHELINNEWFAKTF